jgi:imidazoleglycerol phosphate dehydratase HisB
MQMRKVQLERTTKETDIRLTLNIDGSGQGTVRTGIPFFDHMLHSMAKHGGFDLDCTVKGDLGIDSHHTVEDTGIVLGDAIRQGIGDGRGIRRFAHAIIPMDEALATVALDCGGRGYLVYSGSFGEAMMPGIHSEIFEHFFHSLCIRAGITAHISFNGRNDHHKCEAVFKAFGIALSGALGLTGMKSVPSTKGKL